MLGLAISPKLPSRRQQSDHVETKEFVIGVSLFLVNLLLYCVTTMLINIVLSKFHMSAFEVTYQFSAPLVLISYLGMRKSVPADYDFLSIPRKIFWPLMGRCFCGFLTDVTMFLAFVYTAYSKAFCVHMMAPFISPFIA